MKQKAQRVFEAKSMKMSGECKITQSPEKILRFLDQIWLRGLRRQVHIPVFWKGQPLLETRANGSAEGDGHVRAGSSSLSEEEEES